MELKESECQVVMERYFLNVSQINAMLQSYEELTQRIATLSKMVRTNKMLKKKTNETECRGKQLALEIEDLIKAIREMESSTEIAREHLDLLRKNVIKLETTLFEAAKKVKQTIELEVKSLLFLTQAKPRFKQLKLHRRKKRKKMRKKGDF